MFHEWHEDTSGKETNKHVVVSDASASGVALEGGDITFQ